MKVYLLDPKLVKPTATELDRGSYTELIKFASISTSSHICVEDIAEADFIIACISGVGYGQFLRTLKHHEIYKKYKRKIFIYSADDNQYPSIPGIYPALDKSFYNDGWAVGGHYFASFIRRHEFNILPYSSKDILFSFVGSSKNHEIRSRILKLSCSRSLLHDSTPVLNHWWDDTSEEREKTLGRFKDVMSRSKFCLCPRGVSASSIRLFEAMQAGVVPVIIADDLVLPDGPDWEQFSITISESDISMIPEILETKDVEAKSEIMGQLARKAWENYFSPESSFETIISYVIDLNRKLERRRNLLESKVAIGEMSLPNLRVRLRGLYHKIKLSRYIN
jgi:Exostosin family